MLYAVKVSQMIMSIVELLVRLCALKTEIYSTPKFFSSLSLEVEQGRETISQLAFNPSSCASLQWPKTHWLWLQALFYILLNLGLVFPNGIP